MSRLELAPTDQPFDVRLNLPGSKSFSNRALTVGALSGQAFEVHNASPSNDTSLMLNALVDMGWGVACTNPMSRDVKLSPTVRPNSGANLFTGPAGTTTRFALALLAATPGTHRLDANERMRERPMRDLIEGLRVLGARIDGDALPLVVDGGGLRGGEVKLRADVSSQFVSALLMIAPRCSEPVRIELVGDAVSASYIDMTLEVMQQFGIADNQVTRTDNVITVQTSAYRGGTYMCPTDSTGAGYFWASAALTGGVCVIDGLRRDDVQADTQLVNALEAMGCDVLEPSGGLGVRGPNRLGAIEWDMTDLPDSAQTLAVVCAFAEGRSRLTGLSTLREKETDRINALANELPKLGASVSVGDDWIEIVGAATLPNERATIATYDDHRMAMSFGVAGFRARVAIEDPDCVGKSFPEFWDYLAKLR